MWSPTISVPTTHTGPNAPMSAGVPSGSGSAGSPASMAALPGSNVSTAVSQSPVHEVNSGSPYTGVVPSEPKLVFGIAFCHKV
jgi:hypothetical protein